MRQLRSLFTTARPVADVLLDRLRRFKSGTDAHGRESGDCLAEQGTLALEHESDFGAQPSSANPILPDQALAAVLLGRALDGNRQVIASLAEGGLVLIDFAAPELFVPLYTVFHRTLIDPGWSVKDGFGLQPADAQSSSPNTIIVFRQDGTEAKNRSTTSNIAAGIALQMRCPIVAIAANAERTLPRELIRAADHRLSLPPIDVAAVAAVVQVVTGSAPQAIDEALASRVTLADLMSAIRADRRAEECMQRLQRLIAPAKADTTNVPSLLDMHGLGEAKDFAIALVEDLKDYKAGRLPASALPKGLLLSSPPGCGKTALARAIANSVGGGVHFIPTSYSAWQSSKDGALGAVTKAIRATFDEARENAPCILFIDEVDSLPSRGSDQRYDNWWTSVVNCLLEELDGFDRKEAVVVIAACNDPHRLDPALTRSGRLDKHIRIELPDPIALAAILRSHLGSDLAAIDLRPVAAIASGSSGADAERWVRAARRRARKAGRDVVRDDLVAEIREGRPEFPEALRRRVAYHEAGHGLSAFVLGIGEPKSLAVSASGGATLVEPGEIRAFTAAEIRARIVFTMAGRAAEALVYGGEVSAGSGSGGERSDLAIATSLALGLEVSYGLGAQGALWFGDTRKLDLLHDPEIRAAARRTLEQAEAAAGELLQCHRASLERLAAALFDKGFLDQHEIRTALALGVVTTAPGGLIAGQPLAAVPTE
jgi:ATP-dependent Zn protease